MENLPLTPEEVEGVLKQIPGFEAGKLKAFFDEKKKGRHFYKIRFAPGEIIMPRGVYSDYAAVLLQGSIWVPDVEPESLDGPHVAPSCWKRPGPFARWLKNWVIDRTDRLAKPSSRGKSEGADPELSWWARMERVLARKLRPWLPGPRREHALADPLTVGVMVPGKKGLVSPETTFRSRTAQGKEFPLLDRFLDVINVVWNQPRQVTLMAGLDDQGGKNPCELLLIKRKALLELILEKSPPFYQNRSKAFLKHSLPRMLAENRLFRSSLSLEDIPPAQWPRLVALLQEAGGPSSSLPIQRIQQLVDDRFRSLVADLVPEKLTLSLKYRIVSEINRVLQRRDFYAPQYWPSGFLRPDVRKLLGRDRASLMENEVVWLNRLLLEAAFPDIVCPAGDFRPLRAEDFRELVQFIFGLTNQSLHLQRYESGAVIYDRGDAADAVYLVMSGMLSVTREVPGGRMLVLHLERNGFFGESCLEEGARRRSRVEALTSVNLLRLERSVVLRLVQQYPALGEKLHREQTRTRERDRDLQTGHRAPPKHPPQEIATRLMRTTNLLLIDMNRCTRCDQCVRACAEAHDGQPRFHRSNPELRFGKWEVAAACLHCTDAPCQEACPVGAITFLHNGAVQIHRNRCIGCADCVPACPFDVIDMYPPTGPEDAARATQKVVASKCDLCLTRDRDPPCVASCPYGAAQRGAPWDLFPEIKGWENNT